MADQKKNGKENNGHAEDVATKTTNGVSVEDAPFRCDACDIPFDLSCQLARHRFLVHSYFHHRKPKKMTCADLTKFVQNHSGGGPTRNPRSLRRMPRQSTGSDSIAMSLPTAESDLAQYKCSECPMTFGLFSTLKVHEKVHSLLKSFPDVDLSQWDFEASVEVLDHEEGDFACDVCEVKFSSPARLKSHVDCHKLLEAFEKEL